MKLSTKCRYGTRALIEIARRANLGKPVKRKDISEVQNIPHAYLENILIALKSANIIKTVRGASGGFSLAVSPKTLSLFQIVNALEGSIAPVDCVEKPETCKRAEKCGAMRAWKKWYEAEKALLESMTLQDLVEWETACDAGNYII